MHSRQAFVDPRNMWGSSWPGIPSYPLTLFLRSSSQTHSFSRIPCGCHARCGRMLSMGCPPSSSTKSPHRDRVSCVCVSFVLYSIYLEYDRIDYSPILHRVTPMRPPSAPLGQIVPSLSASPNLSTPPPPHHPCYSPCLPYRVSLMSSQCNTPTSQSPSVLPHPLTRSWLTDQDVRSKAQKARWGSLWSRCRDSNP